MKQLIFVLALGIHNEVPGKFGEWNSATIGENQKPFHPKLLELFTAKPRRFHAFPYTGDVPRFARA